MSAPPGRRASVRLSAAERRARLLDTASRAFAGGSFRGTTTGEIARAAGVTEPVLYRHFPSKRDLFLACLAESWGRIRALWERELLAEPEPREWVPALARSFRASEERIVVHALWVQALAEASEDAAIRRYMQRHMREVHGFVADTIRRSQAAGGIPRDRDAAAEAWIFLSVGFLLAVSTWLGGLIEDDVPSIVASRRRWLVETA